MNELDECCETLCLGCGRSWCREESKPDIDKLLRSTLDALGEAGLWADDSQVVHVQSSKDYADDRPPGALIKVGGAA